MVNDGHPQEEVGGSSPSRVGKKQTTFGGECPSSSVDQEGRRWELSDWGLFSRCEKRVVNQDGTYRQFTYSVAGREVSFLKPVEGVGTNLMHGDFARKLSPSEEALTTWLLKNLRLFHGKRVLVLGTGLGLAPLTCGACSRATCVDMTDGDPEVLRTLRSTLSLNEGRFGATKMSVQELFWTENGKAPQEPYDVIIAADVVYLEEFHQALLSTAYRHLLPTGLFVLLCSKRNGSLDKFANSARHYFPRISIHDDYDEDVLKAIRRSAKCFPIMVKLSPISHAADALIPENVTKCIEEQKEKQLLHRQEEESLLQQMARQQSLQNARTKRMVRKREKRLRKRAAAAAAAAEEAASGIQAASREHDAPRKPTLSKPEQENRSDWNLFARKCRTVEGHDHKEMVYDCAGKDIIIRKPLAGDFFHGDFARKISPSEEALATYIIKHKKAFKKKRVLVLGAGLGLAGFVLGAWTTAKHVEITDGDEHVVEGLKENLGLNEDMMSAKKVVARRLLWGEGVDNLKRFDVIVAADVVYLEDLHPMLLHTLRKLLKPTGTALIFASPRNGSLEAFRLAATGVFDRVRSEKDRDKDVERALHGFKCYPRIIRMHWTQEKANTNTSKIEAAPLVSRSSSTSRKPTLEKPEKVGSGPTPQQISSKEGRPPSCSPPPPPPPPPPQPAPVPPPSSSARASSRSADALEIARALAPSVSTSSSTSVKTMAKKRDPSQSQQPPSRSSRCSSPASVASSRGKNTAKNEVFASEDDSDSLIEDDFDEDLADDSDVEQAPLMYSPDVDDDDEEPLGQDDDDDQDEESDDDGDDDEEDEDDEVHDELCRQGAAIHSGIEQVHDEAFELDVPILPDRDMKPDNRPLDEADRPESIQALASERAWRTSSRRAGSRAAGTAITTAPATARTAATTTTTTTSTAAAAAASASTVADPSVATKLGLSQRIGDSVTGATTSKARPPLPSPSPALSILSPTPPLVTMGPIVVGSVGGKSATTTTALTVTAKAAVGSRSRCPTFTPSPCAGRSTSCSSNCCTSSSSCSSNCRCCSGFSESPSTVSLPTGLSRSSSRTMSVGKLIGSTSLSRASMSTAPSTPRASPCCCDGSESRAFGLQNQHHQQQQKQEHHQKQQQHQQQHYHHQQQQQPNQFNSEAAVPHLPPLLPRPSERPGCARSTAQQMLAMTSAASAPAATASGRAAAAAAAAKHATQQEQSHSYPRTFPTLVGKNSSFSMVAGKASAKTDLPKVSLELVGSSAPGTILASGRKKAPLAPKGPRSRSNSVLTEARSHSATPDLVPGWYCRSLSADPPTSRTLLSANTLACHV